MVKYGANHNIPFWNVFHCRHLLYRMNLNEGPVVQTIVSLTSSLRGQLVLQLYNKIY